MNVKKYSIKNKTPEFEGKSKKFYKLTDDLYFMVFKPHLRSITYNRESNIVGTDIERLKCCLYIMNIFEYFHKSNPTKYPFKTHLKHDKIVEIDGQLGLLVEKTKTIPLEFICRYYAAGSIVRMYPSLVKDGQKFKTPLYKFDVKQDVSVNGVDDPTINENYIVGLDILTQKQFDYAKFMLQSIGDTINNLLESSEIKLIDMKMEFGISEKTGEIILIDEISQDCIRANDIYTNVTLTKDCYRNMKSDEEVLEAYKEFLYKIEIYPFKALWSRMPKDI